MPKKSNHKHDYVKYVRYKGPSPTGPNYDVVSVCATCGKIRPLAFREHLLKAGNGYVWLCRLEDIRKVFGDIPMLDAGDDSKDQGV